MADKTDAKHGGEKPQAKNFSGARSEDKRSEKPRGRPQQAVAKPIISASGKEVKGIVRLAGRDLRGSLPLRRAITSVKGIGINLGEVISVIACAQLGATEDSMVGELSEPQVERLEHILKNPGDFGVPVRMMNRQKDIFTGNSMHLIGSDLTFTVRQDIDHEKDSNTWKGYRHAYGQKVRGQHTRSTGRTGMTVGVLRKAVLAKAGAAAAAAAAGAAAPVAPGAPGAAPAGATGAKGASAAGAKAPAGGAAPAKGAPAPSAGGKPPAAPAGKAAAPAAKAPEKKEAKK